MVSLDPIVKKLAGPLLLMLGICVASGLMFLRPEGTQQAIPPLSKISYVFVCVGALAFASWLHIKDRRIEVEESRRVNAEKAKNEVETATKDLLGTIPKGGQHRDLWTRPILQIPLKQAVLENIIQVFDAALGEVSEALALFDTTPDNPTLRANVFLPTSNGVLAGDVCNLIIPRQDLGAPDGLQRNMQNLDELSLAFRPNQGATGRAFVEGRAVGVLTDPRWQDEKDESKRKKIDRWVYVRLHPDGDLSKPGESPPPPLRRSHFEMTNLQDRLVDEKTAWLISMPVLLKMNATPEVVGVFNVDCLDCRLKPEQLRAIYYRVAPFAGVLAGIVHGSPTDRVVIFKFKE